MTKHTYDAEHVHHLQQVDKTHEHTKALHELAEEALKYHDKYLHAIEKLTTSLMDNSNCMEEMRKSFKDNGQGMTATYEVTAAVAAAFNTFKASVEVKTLRDCLCRLSDVSTIAKRNAKVTRGKIEEFDVAAKKHAKRTAGDYQQKLAQATGKKKEKLLHEDQAEEELLKKMDGTVKESLHSLCAWWAERLTTESEELYKTYRDVGTHLARCYSDNSQLTAPPPSTMHQHAALHPRASPGAGSDARGTTRDDTSSYIGISDYLSQPASYLPPTEVRGRHVSSDRTSVEPSLPPPLYPSVHKDAVPAASAPPDDGSGCYPCDAPS